MDNPFLPSDHEPQFAILRKRTRGALEGRTSFIVGFTLVCLECSRVTEHRSLFGSTGVYEEQKKHRAEHLGLTDG